MRYLKFFNEYQQEKTEKLEFELLISFISKVFVILQNKNNNNILYIEALKILKNDEYIINDNKINYQKFKKQKIEIKEEILDIIYIIITPEELKKSDEIEKKIKKIFKSEINDNLFLENYLNENSDIWR